MAESIVFPKEIRESTDIIQQKITAKHRSHHGIIANIKIMQSILRDIPLPIIKVIVAFGDCNESINAYDAIQKLYDRINPFQFMIHKGCHINTIKYHFERLDLDINNPNLKPVIFSLELCNSVQLLPFHPSYNHSYEPELTLIKLENWSDPINSIRKGQYSLKYVFKSFKNQNISDYILIGEMTGHQSGVTHSFVLLHKITGKIYGCSYCTVAGAEEEFRFVANSFDEWIKDCGSNYWANLRNVVGHHAVHYAAYQV
eukprot:UN09840